MKKEELLHIFLTPILVIALGLILLVNPDSASVLLAKAISWVLIAIAIGCGIAAIARPVNRPLKVAAAIIFAVAGGWLGRNPLMLAASIGRFLGIFLMIQGLQKIFLNKKQGQTFLLPGILTLVGFVLLLLPMTTSRLLFSLCGLVVLLVGIVMLLDGLRQKKRLEEPEDPNIIDAL